MRGVSEGHVRRRRERSRERPRKPLRRRDKRRHVPLAIRKRPALSLGAPRYRPEDDLRSFRRACERRGRSSSSAPRAIHRNMAVLGALGKTGFSVKTPVYEGPFELLLDLIEERKLLINDISLSSVTDEFIQRVRSSAAFPMEEAANFVSVAATLLLIKSRSLIPEIALTEDEEADIKDLEARLAAYQKAREASRELARLFGRTVLVARGGRTPDPVFAPSKDLSAENLAAALGNALAALEKQEQLPEARVKPMITIEEMMERLAGGGEKAMNLSFPEFSGSLKEKVEVIVSFLALLELVKQGAVEAAQHEHFADIRITNTSAAVPRYG